MVVVGGEKEFEWEAWEEKEVSWLKKGQECKLAEKKSVELQEE